jgi:hypothetical protein
VTYISTDDEKFSPHAILALNLLALMKPFRLTLISAFALLFFSYDADAQRNWWRYGVDEMIVVPVKQQPKIIDTLGQTFFFSETDYGTIMINKAPSGGGYSSKEEFDQFNADFLKGVTMNGEIELISHHADTFKSVPCMRFTFRKRSSNVEGHGLGVVAGNRAYGFQFIYAPENAALASAESEYFFSNIEFSALVTTANSGEKQFGYMIEMGLGLFVMIMVPASLVGVVVLAIRYFRKRRKTA